MLYRRKTENGKGKTEMIYVTNGTRRYASTAPDEHRINIYPQKRQWVLDFTICDTVTASDMDGLLDGTDLTFIYDPGGPDEHSVTFSGYKNINSITIKYNQDLSCTATIQLGGEIITNAC